MIPDLYLRVKKNPYVSYRIYATKGLYRWRPDRSIDISSILGTDVLAAREIYYDLKAGTFQELDVMIID